MKKVTFLLTVWFISVSANLSATPASQEKGRPLLDSVESSMLVAQSILFTFIGDKSEGIFPTLNTSARIAGSLTMIAAAAAVGYYNEKFSFLTLKDKDSLKNRLGKSLAAGATLGIISGAAGWAVAQGINKLL